MATPTWAVLAVYVLFQYVTASDYTSLVWKDCGSDASMTIHKIDISPMPILLPGNVSISVQASSTTSQFRQMKLSIHVKRDTFLLNIPIPCIFHIGSCTYDNLCTVLTTMQTENWAGIGRGVSNQIQGMLSSFNMSSPCSPHPTNINIHNYVLALPPIPTVLSWFAEGNYEAHVTAVDAITGSQLLCLDFKATLKKYSKPCTGWFCGRRKRH